MSVDPEKEISLRQNLEQVGPDTEELFEDEFLQEHTSYDTFDEFIRDLGGYNPRGEIPFQLTIGDADKVVEKKTEFDSWFEMQDEALSEFWADEGQNRRRHTRHDCDIDVVLEVGSDQFRGKIVDISKSGLGLQTEGDIPNTRFIKVHIPMEKLGEGSGIMILRGAIRWKSDGTPCNLGLELMSKHKPS